MLSKSEMLGQLDQLIQRIFLGRKPVRKTGTLVMYKYLDHFLKAIETGKKSPLMEKAEYYSPTSYHEVEHACGFGFSPVRWFTLVGGLTGCLTGFLVCMFFDLDWPLVVGGKTPGIFSAPVFVIICFELTILFGGIGTILGMLVFCRIPDPKVQIFNSSLTDDTFGVFIPDVDQSNKVVTALTAIGENTVQSIGATE